jgi:hypothetical protein
MPPATTARVRALVDFLVARFGAGAELASQQSSG